LADSRRPWCARPSSRHHCDGRSRGERRQDENRCHRRHRPHPAKLVEQLREDGHDPLAASPDTGVDTLTGEGLAEAITGAEVVVDVANAPDWDDAAVLNFFQTSARNLLPRRPMTSPPPWPTSP
jgi:hypothetical protein